MCFSRFLFNKKPEKNARKKKTDYNFTESGSYGDIGGTDIREGKEFAGNKFSGRCS